VHQESLGGVYGVKKVWHELLREGIRVARCTVRRLMPRQYPKAKWQRCIVHFYRNVRAMFKASYHVTFGPFPEPLARYEEPVFQELLWL